MGLVLIVDDEESILDHMVRVVSEAGHQVKGVRNGSLAVEALESFDADIIITDLNMPIMNGLQMAKYLRSRDFQRPIIVITGYDDHKERAKRLGVTGFVSKPFKDQELIDCIAGYCKK